jgi:hypothetical protein
MSRHVPRVARRELRTIHADQLGFGHSVKPGPPSPHPLSSIHSKQPFCKCREHLFASHRLTLIGIALRT